MRNTTKLSCILLALSATHTAFAQNQYSVNSIADAITPTTKEVTAVNGGVITYNTLADFQTAAPTADNSEDFETNNTGGALLVCPEDINSTVNSACFTPGQVIDGFNITALPAPGNGTVVLPAGFNGLTSTVVGPGTFTDITELSFTDSDVQAVAFDVYAGLAAADITITIFDVSDTLVDTLTVTGVGALPDNQFLGFTAASPISRVVIESQGGVGELIDNLLFGPVGPPPSAEVSVNPASGSNLNFGNGGTSGSSSVTIINAASATVDLTNVNCSFSGGDAANFNVDTLLPGGPIAPGGSLNIALSATVAAGENLSSTLTCTYDGDASNTSSSWSASISGRPRVIPSLGFYGMFALASLLLLVAFGTRRKFG